jgi:hypothetical protein
MLFLWVNTKEAFHILSLSEKTKESVRMQQEAYLVSMVQKYIPPGSELAVIKGVYPKMAVCIADIDSDGIPEMIAGYKWQGNPYVMILKYHQYAWYKIATIKGTGYDINYLDVAPVSSKKTNDIIVGWQVGAIWSELTIFTYINQTLKEIVKGIHYSSIEVEDMPGEKGKDGRAEIALWQHDTGMAYKVEVYRWANGKLVPALDVYPYYFKKVVIYYKRKVKETPEAAFYWYYLADAQLKAGMPEKALQSIERGLALNPSYPSKAQWIVLKEQAEGKGKARRIQLYPAPVKEVGGRKWGYINEKGHFIIPPTYSYAYPFQENGLAIVEEKSKYGIINEAGQFIAEPTYDFINSFSEGLAVVYDQTGVKVINEKGKEITAKTYPYIASFQDGRAVFQNKEMQYGYLDKEGKEVIPAKYQYANNFQEGKAVVKIRDGVYALIDRNGNMLQQYSYDFVGNLGDGLLAFQEKGPGKYGFIDEKGRVVISPTYTGTAPFVKGRTIVNVAEDYKSRYGLIDKTGTFIIKPEYNDIQRLGESRVAVGIALDKENPFFGSKYAIYDTDGHRLTDFIYTGVSPYEDGLASVSDDKETFFIDRSGRRAAGWPVVRGTGTLSVEGDIISANVDQKTFYLDKKGKIIWQQNTIIPLDGAYRVKEEKFKPNKDYIVYYPQLSGIPDKEKEMFVNNRLKTLSEVKDINATIQLDYHYTGDFSVPFFQKHLLVLKLFAYKYYFGAAHGMPTEIYPHVDLHSGQFYELKDLFKKNSQYVKVLSDIVENQIKTNPEYSYVWPEQYKGIKENQPFYITNDALYLYFYPYEIAAYAAGFPAFKIPYQQIMDRIDTQGAFWKSFHA